MFELPPLPSGIRLLTDPEGDRLRKQYENVPVSPEQCITCGGKGEFEWWSYASITPTEKPEIGTFKCNCEDQFALHRYLLHSNIGLAYQRLGWHDVAAEEGAVEKVLDYLDHADAYVNQGCGLILYGPAGTGKTLLAVLILKRMLAEGYDGYLTTFSGMIDKYTGGWTDADERYWFHRRIKNVRVLVLDDVGREWQGRQKHGLPESTFDEVLRHRVASSTPTIITTNHDLDKLKQGYGGYVMSLLHERSTTYRFVGEDFRDQSRLRTDEEIEKGLTRPVVIG